MNLPAQNLETQDFHEFDFHQEITFAEKHFLKLIKGNNIQPKDIKITDLQFFISKALLESNLISLIKEAIASQEKRTLTTDGNPEEKSVIPKTSYLVFKNQKYKTVQTENIAYFYVGENKVNFVSFDKQEYSLDLSLKQITESVSERQFFRINRKYLINFKAIKEVEHYFMRKLFVKLNIETPDSLLINKENTTAFLSWMSER